uniref:Protein kinase domain-containing protein n=1 Tax=Romanomermis culicivorax TaxID=13658 RepID=A0A915KJ31_ROMCU
MTVTSTTGDSSISIYNERWRVKRLLGAGGCGFVYEVEDLRSSNGYSYAMKTEIVKRPNHPGRLPQEVLVIRSLEKNKRSRHVVEILDKGRVTETGSQPLQYIVMTLLGPSLSDLTVFCKKNVFAPATVALVAIQTLEAIEDLHVTGFIHRDINTALTKLGLRAKKNYTNQGKLAVALMGMSLKNGALNPPQVLQQGNIYICSETLNELELMIMECFAYLASTNLFS